MALCGAQVNCWLPTFRHKLSGLIRKGQVDLCWWQRQVASKRLSSITKLRLVAIQTKEGLLRISVFETLHGSPPLDSNLPTDSSPYDHHGPKLHVSSHTRLCLPLGFAHRQAWCTKSLQTFDARQMSQQLHTASYDLQYDGGGGQKVKQLNRLMNIRMYIIAQTNTTFY